MPVGERVYEYFHQLQNLCLVLTGAELEVHFSDTMLQLKGW